MKPDDTASAPKSLVLHSMASYYDLLAAFMTLGRERELRDRLASLADVAPGESVLDVGCGTGSLALAAKRRVGPTGIVTGIDASPEMIERARRKPESSQDVYDLTLCALLPAFAETPEDNEEALRLLSLALEKDPSYPTANALAAWCRQQRHLMEWAGPTR